MAGYEFAFGLDLGGTPLTKDNKKVAQAILLGRDSGRLTSSAQPLRIAGASESIYLAMRLAVYSTGLPVDTVEQRRIAYIGSVGAAFDVDSMMKSAIKSNLLPFVHLKLYDKGSSTGQRHSDSTEIRQLLYDTHPQAAVTAKLAAMDSANSMIVHKIPLELAGRIWEVEFRAPRNETTRGIDQWLPSLVMSAGLLLTALLFAVVYTLTTSRGRAIALAGEITKDLRESESGLAEAQQVAHLGSWTLNPATWRMSWSAETYRILEMEVRTSPEDYAEALKVVHKDDRAPLDKAFRHAVENGLSAHVDHRVCLPNGKIRWLHTIIRPVVHGQRGLMRGTIMDITERKRADNAVKESRQQLLALSRRLVDIQEVERRRFSTELHDVVGQNLTALSFNLDILKTQLSGNENNAVNLRLDDSAKLVRSTSDAVDNVLSELRPPMLDDYGLFAALQWYAEQFSIRTGVQAVVHGDESIQRLKPVAEIALFRVAQEALNNIAKHACANGVEIRLERTASQCVMSVSDDGKGFDVAARAIFHRKNGSDAVATTERRRERLGMVTMRERVLAVGGTFEVKSAPGQGTRVELRVPY
jgi:signal transduction histidine kinase